MSSSHQEGRRKWMLRVALAFAVGVAGLGLLGAIGWGVSSVTQSEETADVLTIASALPPDLVEAVTWLPDDPDLPRPMEPLTRADVSAAWLRAWSQLAVLAETGDPTGLEVYFSNSALRGAELLALGWADRPVRQIGHDLRLTFYSEDGQVIGLTAERSRLLRAEVLPRSEQHLAYFDSEESYDVVLLLEDGNWRVQHWVRTGVDGTWWNEPLEPATRPLETTSPRTANSDTDSPLADMAAVVFDPSMTSEARGRYFDETVGQARVARVLLGFDALGGRAVDDVALAQLIDWLDDLEARDVDVVASLFHERSDHQPERWDADDRHLDGLVPDLAAHPAVILYDLRFAADRDSGDPASRDLVDAWLGHVGRIVRSLDPATPITIGWSDAKAALAAPGIEDVVTFVTADAAAEQAELRALLIDGRPVFALGSVPEEP